MRRRALALIVGLTGCGYMTDGLPPELGRCADSTGEWWPLRERNSWVYDEIKLHRTPPEARKDLSVQRAPSSVPGLTVPQEGIRTWRHDPDKTGWRWFIREDSAYWFRHDVLVDPTTEGIPCEDLGPDDDPRTRCPEAAPIRDITYLPGRKRLDYREDRVCEGSAWTESHLKAEISIGDGEDECPLAEWRQGSDGCTATITTEEDHWSVSFVSRRIEVPAGVFDDCLCVRRVIEDPLEPEDSTFCFASGVGKVYELDRGNLVECLAEYEVDGVSVTDRPGPDCSPDLLGE